MSIGETDRLGEVVERRRLPGFLGVVGADGLGIVRYVSPLLAERLGVAAVDVIGRPFLDFVAEGDTAKASTSFDGTVDRAGHHQMLEFQLRLPSGDRLPIDVVGENCLGEPGIELVLLHLGDPADRRRSVQLLRLQSEVVRKIALSATLEEAADEILRFVERAMPGFRAAAYFDDDRIAGRATAAPTLPSALTGRLASAIHHDPTTPGGSALQFDEIVIAADLGEERWATTADLLRGTARAVWSVPIRHDRRSPSMGCIEIYCPDPAHPGAEDWSVLWLVSGLAAVAHDRVEMQQRLVRDADIDPLTGTPNRRVLSALLAAILDGPEDDRGRVVCFIDLDRLKVVNDGLGHEAGDHVIREAAHRLRAHVGDAGVVGRFGGDEFVAISSNAGVPHAELAARCLEAFSSPVDVAGRPWQLSASVGVVEIDEQRTPGEVLRDADAAMYEAKRAGRNRWRLFATTTRATVVRRMRLEEQLPRAVRRGEIVAWFQPLVSMSDWSPCGVELLARWRPTGGSWVPPEEFIPLIEELGLIDLFGNQMIERALEILADLDRMAVGACRASVNVSPVQLQAGVLRKRIELAREHGLPVDRLCLEMTEQHMVDESERTLDQLERLISLDVGLAVDDFGTGYSSLGALHRLPARNLKIDRRLVSQVGTERGDAVVSAVIGVARAFGMETVAEGVERPEQALRLRALGADHAQGYLFARPEPREQYLRRIASTGWWWDVDPEAIIDRSV